MAANGSIKALDRQFVPKNFRAKFRFPGDDLNFNVLAIEFLKI